MTSAFGLHFGSTSACLALYKAVGLSAKQGIIRNAANTVQNVKQLLGCNFSDPAVKKMRQSSTAVIIDKNDQPMYDINFQGKQMLYSPLQIVHLIFKKLMGTAQAHGDGDGDDAVLAVPLNFSHRQMKELSSGAELAGFNILRVINEPSAALLAYDIGQTDIHEFGNVIVYKMGGSSLHLTIVNVSNGLYRIISSIENDYIGGSLFDQVLVDHFVGEFKKKWGIEIKNSNRARYKLLNAAENCKHILSKMHEAHSFIESLHEGIDFQCQISRARFDGLCSSLVQRCMEPLVDILNQSEMRRDDISKVILCGGSTKIPYLQQQIQNYFPHAEMLFSIPPDEVVAVGAAKEASILTGNEEEAKLLEKCTDMPCIQKSIRIKFIEGCTDLAQPDIVFHSFTPFPVKRIIHAKLDEAATRCDIHVLEGKYENTPLAHLMLDELPPQALISIVFHIRREGSLHVTCSEKSSGKSCDVHIEFDVMEPEN
ncbi:heat shock 70 kDa protein 14-like isoform X2 [Tubulanus polymorphus]|uniref:heat shock 70 kDa protein 14-like isoform X2 n=1 Tax=Tubulanus polymorphus TaxID=672921 RepID=UPI003DA54842